MYIVGDATSNWNDYDEDGEIIYWREKRWIMLQCPACENVSLYTEYQAYDTPLDVEYVYPQDTFVGFSGNRWDGYRVPENIRNAFEASLKVQRIDSQLCLVSMRKTIELICKDQGAAGHTLEQLVESLAKKNDWPEAYRDICSIIRYYGNIAAHSVSEKTILNTKNMDRMMRFLYKIIEFLYIMPKQVFDMKPRALHRF